MKKINKTAKKGKKIEAFRCLCLDNENCRHSKLKKEEQCTCEVYDFNPHTKQDHFPKADSTESWEIKAISFLKQFVMHDSVAHSRIDGTIGDCLGCKADLDAVIDFISSEREKVRQEERERVRDKIITEFNGYGGKLGFTKEELLNLTNKQ